MRAIHFQFFLLYGSFAAVQPYLPILLKERGLSPEEIGLVSEESERFATVLQHYRSGNLLGALEAMPAIWRSATAHRRERSVGSPLVTESCWPMNDGYSQTTARWVGLRR